MSDQPPKDLFVELARLTGLVGTAADLAVTLRSDMVADSPRQAETQTILADHLLHITEDARELSAALRTNQVGISLTAEDEPAEPPAEETINPS